MTPYEQLRDIGRPVAVYPRLTKALGSTTAMLFFCQLMYWDGKGDDEDGWIYKTQDEWEEEIGLTRREQETARKRLKAAGVLEERRRGVPAKLYYRINHEAASTVLSSVWRNPPYKSGGIRQTRVAESARLFNTETTPESTAYITPDPPSGVTLEPLGDMARNANGAGQQKQFVFLSTKGEWTLPPEKRQEWQLLYADVLDVERELRKARQWLIDNPRRRKEPAGMVRFLGAWLSRAEDAAKRPPPTNGGRVSATPIGDDDDLPF